MAGDGADREVEEWCRDLGVDPFVVFDLSVAEVEEGLPADEASGCAEAAAEVVRVGSGQGVVEDEPEEWFAVVAGEVGAVGGADHRVAEAVGGALELDRDVRVAFAWSVEAAAVAEDVVDDRLADEQGQ